MNSKKTYFLQQYLNGAYDHGGIGFVDIEKLLFTYLFIPISLKSTHFILRIFEMMKLYFKLNKQDTIYFIFPVYAKMNTLFLKLLAYKKCNIICVYGDSDGLRHVDEKLLKNELNFISFFNNIIVHNETMASWLQKQYPEKNIQSLCLFDYLTPQQQKNNRQKGTEIAFAGNLSKSKFLNHLDEIYISNPRLKFNLYGKNSFIEKVNCFYKGFFSPYDTPNNLQGSFGLIWDGASLENCEGDYGHYLMFSTPHKLSVYILASLPIIIHQDAAMAAFVLEKNIGFCVSSLYEIEEKINSISETEYQQMVENMKPIAKNISAGHYLQTAIENILK